MAQIPHEAPEASSGSIIQAQAQERYRKKAMIKQIIPAGCNRECFALTDQGQLWLLQYHADDSFDWILMERPHRSRLVEDFEVTGNGHTSEATT